MKSLLSFSFHLQIYCKFIIEFSLFTGRLQAKLPKQMRTFDESLKSKKTVASMIERKGGDKQAPPKKSVKIVEEQPEEKLTPPENGQLSEDVLIANRRKLAEKLAGNKKKTVDTK